MAEIKKQAIDLEKISNSNEDDLFYFVDTNTVSSERITAPRYSYWKSVFRIFFKKPTNWIALFFLAFIIGMAIIFPMIAPYNEFENTMRSSYFNLSPSAAIDKFGFKFKWLLGTGPYGNSIFYGIWSGARTSLSLALVCAVINMTLGVVIGAVWGYSKALDVILNFVYQIIANVPYILLISVLVYAVGSGFAQFVFALTITGWVGIAYFFRTQVMIIRDREYNLASRCLGTPIRRVVSRNIMPFLTSVIVTILATELPSYISMEVFLSYIGIGLSADMPSLGKMIGQAQGGFVAYPWAFWAPVSIAALITIILYVIGQNLADASDPRTHM